MQTTTAPTSTNGSVLKKSNSIFTVYATHNYEQFKLMKDNRDLNPQHLRRLVDSFKEQHLVCPLIVNEKLEVIDGQHRLAASKETGAIVHYIIVPGYSIKEVQILNANQKNWTKLDFLEMYVAQGKPRYIEFREFMDTFPDLGFAACEMLLTGTHGGNERKNIDGKTVLMKDFQEGRLVIPSLIMSYKNARKVLEFKPFYDGVDRRAFVAAVLPLFRSKVYNHKEMIYKLGVAPKKMEHQQNILQYREALEDIYNWKRLKENKVSFKYE